VFNDFFGTTGTLKETDDVQADENIKDSQSTNNNTESDEENVSENNKTVLNSQSENDTIKEMSILQVLCKYKIVQKNLFKWTELNSVRFYIIRKISTCQ